MAASHRRRRRSQDSHGMRIALLPYRLSRWWRRWWELVVSWFGDKTPLWDEEDEHIEVQLSTRSSLQSERTFLASHPPVGRKSASYARQSKDIDEFLEPDENLYEVVYMGGAYLRTGVELDSNQIRILRRKELVIGTEERGRRVAVRTLEGVRGWMSLATGEDVPILRLVAQGPRSRGTRERVCDGSLEREEKWQHVSVVADGREARPLPLRGAVPSIPIDRWRPAIDVIGPKMRSSPTGSETVEDVMAIQRVPRLAGPSGVVHDPVTFGVVQQESSSVRREGDLLDLLGPEAEHTVALPVARGEDLLDLDQFDTQEVTSRIPSLAEALSAAAAHGGNGRQNCVQLARLSGRQVVRDVAANGHQIKACSVGIPEAPPSRGSDRLHQPKGDLLQVLGEPTRPHTFCSDAKDVEALESLEERLYSWALEGLEGGADSLEEEDEFIVQPQFGFADFSESEQESEHEIGTNEMTQVSSLEKVSAAAFASFSQDPSSKVLPCPVTEPVVDNNEAVDLGAGDAVIFHSPITK